MSELVIDTDTSGADEFSAAMDRDRGSARAGCARRRRLFAVTLTTPAVKAEKTSSAGNAEIRNRNLCTVSRRDETASLLQRSPHQDIGFLDDIRQGRRIGDTRCLFATAYRAENRLRNRAAREPDPYIFQRYTAERLLVGRRCDVRPKARLSLASYLGLQLGVQIKVEGI